MSRTPYEILPPEREWPNATENVARRLVLGAGQHGDLAALSLLFRAPGEVWTHPEVLAYYTELGRPNGSTRMVVLWSRLYLRALNREIPGATDEQYAAVMLACSMANELCPVRLGDVLGHLTQSTRRAFTDAMAYLAGK